MDLQSKPIAQRMRQMARLKMEVSKDPTVASLSVLDLLALEYFDDVVNALKSISQSSVSECGQHVLDASFCCGCRSCSSTHWFCCGWRSSTPTESSFCSGCRFTVSVRRASAHNAHAHCAYWVDQGLGFDLSRSTPPCHNNTTHM